MFTKGETTDETKPCACKDVKKLLLMYTSVMKRLTALEDAFRNEQESSKKKCSRRRKVDASRDIKASQLSRVDEDVDEDKVDERISRSTSVITSSVAPETEQDSDTESRSP